MSSLRLHQSDTAISSYCVCRVERQIAVVSSIVQSQRWERPHRYKNATKMLQIKMLQKKCYKKKMLQKCYKNGSFHEAGKLERYEDGEYYYGTQTCFCTKDLFSFVCLCAVFLVRSSLLLRTAVSLVFCGAGSCDVAFRPVDQS